MLLMQSVHWTMLCVKCSLEPRATGLCHSSGDMPCMSGSVGWFADRRVDKSDGRGKTEPRA